MLKLTGAVLLTCAGLCIGTLRSGRMKRREETLEALIRLILWLENRLRYTAAPLADLMEQAAEEDFSPLHIRRLCAGEPFSVCWSALADGTDLCGEDRALMRRLGQEMGRTDLEGQLAHLAMYRSELEKRRQQAAEEYSRKGRVPVALWTAGAVALALLLL